MEENPPRIGDLMPIDIVIPGVRNLHGCRGSRMVPGKHLEVDIDEHRQFLILTPTEIVGNRLEVFVIGPNLEGDDVFHDNIVVIIARRNGRPVFIRVLLEAVFPSGDCIVCPASATHESIPIRDFVPFGIQHARHVIHNLLPVTPFFA